MAFRVAVEHDRPALSPVWMSRNMQVPDPPVVANGVVFAIQTGENTQQRFFGERGAALGVDPPKMRATPVTNLILYAFDAQTGRELYSSEKIINGWVHFSEPVVAGGARLRGFLGRPCLLLRTETVTVATIFSSRRPYLRTRERLLGKPDLLSSAWKVGFL
jgi:hypothetical protein